MDSRSNKRRRHNNGFSVAGPTNAKSEDSELDMMGSDATSDDSPNTTTPGQVQVVDMSASLAAPEKLTQSTVVGGALRRNSDGTYVTPHIVKRRKIGQRASFRWWSKQSAQPVSESEPDLSFDSSDSANDAKEDENDEVNSFSGPVSDSDSDGEGSSHAVTNAASV
ncbi:hypothetical protein J3R83DRAFT_11982 [Lanmaoa asiatica]|nr:hypothetical protein J3R83DRAFT_11982 [Lanmaoa asiatica]